MTKTQILLFAILFFTFNSCRQHEMERQLTFGILSSDSWSKQPIYRLTENFILVDTTENYWNARFTREGYHFTESIKIPIDNKSILNIFNKVPNDFFLEHLQRINKPGNKMEYLTYIDLHLNGHNICGVIDEYDEPDYKKLNPTTIEFKNELHKLDSLLYKMTNNYR